MKNDFFTAKQHKFAKVNSTDGKDHQKKGKSNFSNKKARCSNKREHKNIASHESEIE